MMIEIRRQRTLADEMVYGAMVSEEHLLYKINNLADFSFVNREMAQFYHETLGRIAIEPEILARAMVVQYLYNWSDRVCADMVANHITVKWFVGLGVEQRGFDFSLLSKHRKRLRENDQERLVFDAIVEQLIAAGFIARKEKVFMDATHLAADVAIPTVTRLLRDGIELMLEVLKQEAAPLWAQAVDALALQRYLKEEEKKEYRLDAEEKTARLNRTARDGWRLAKWLRRTLPADAAERLQHTLQLLEKTLADYVQPDDEPPAQKTKRRRARKGNRAGKAKKRSPSTFKEKKEKGKDRLVNIADQDARWGAKSDAKTFAGYKSHIMERTNPGAFLPPNTIQGGKIRKMVAVRQSFRPHSANQKPKSSNTAFFATFSTAYRKGGQGDVINSTSLFLILFSLFPCFVRNIRAPCRPAVFCGKKSMASFQHISRQPVAFKQNHTPGQLQTRRRPLIC